MLDISGMRGTLARMKQQILLSPVFAAGRPDSFDKSQQEAARLQAVSESLRLIIRELNNSEKLAQVRESSLKALPRDQRWSSEQSLRQLAENARVLRGEAQALAELVRDLLDRNGLLNPIQKTKAIADLLKDFERTAGHELQADIQHITSGTILREAGGSATSISMSSVVPTLAFVYLGLKLLARHVSRGKTKTSSG